MLTYTLTSEECVTRGALRIQGVCNGSDGCITAQKSIYALLQKSVTEVQISSNIITFAAVTRYYGLICTSVTDFEESIYGFLRRNAPLRSVTHPSEITVCANTGIAAQHSHYRAILIVINFIIYKLCTFSSLSGFKLRSVKLK